MYNNLTRLNGLYYMSINIDCSPFFTMIYITKQALQLTELFSKT